MKLHLGAPYAQTLCGLPLGQEREAGRVHPKGAVPAEADTCPECWTRMRQMSALGDGKEG